MMNPFEPSSSAQNMQPPEEIWGMAILDDFLVGGNPTATFGARLPPRQLYELTAFNAGRC